ncbi:MAG: GTP cyclohydrolase I FolE2 [Phycisphaerales bacterium]|nr:GTP cyclohydrolase I FolE2 [Phycisphaerales bacterium]
MTTAQHPAQTAIPDVQATPDDRRVAIDKVGVKDVKHPFKLRTPEGGEVATVATISMYVSLPHHQKGTHMSRFMEVLGEHKDALRPDEVAAIAEEVRQRLGAAEAHLEIRFPYFITKRAPVTKTVGLLDCEAGFEVTATAQGVEMSMTVRAPATSLCPCSKEISAYGAHNQRCDIEAQVWTRESIWIEEMVEILESVASSPVYPVLKRADEKFVTEAAFDNPKFVEDTVRDLAVRLDKDERIIKYRITSENYESIHNHNAYAEIAREKGR